MLDDVLLDFVIGACVIFVVVVVLVACVLTGAFVAERIGGFEGLLAAGSLAIFLVCGVGYLARTTPGRRR